MDTIRVTKTALCEFIKEALNGQIEGGSETNPVKINNVVDQQAPITDPTDRDFIPQNQQELSSAISKLVKSIDDEDVSDVYNDIVKSFDQQKEKVDMKKTSVTETVVRNHIKKLIREMFDDELDNELSGEDLTSLKKSKRAKREEEEDLDDDKLSKKKKNLSVADIEGGNLKDIAKEFGGSVAGAKRVTDVALDKAKGGFELLQTDGTEIIERLKEEDPEIGEIIDQFEAEYGASKLAALLALAVDNYIDDISDTGEVTDADVELLRKNPTIVADLDNFREYFHKYYLKVGYGQPWKNR